MRKINLLLPFLILILVSCKETKKENDSGPLIVCTTGMIADAVKNITGADTEVIALMGPGVDPHLYKATQGDLEKLKRADVIVYNGLHLEGKMQEVFKALSKNKTVFAVGDFISSGKLIKTGENTFDPHIWFDVMLWKSGIQGLSAELSKKFPDYSEKWAQNSKRYFERFTALDSIVTSLIASVPSEKRVLITAHDAFSYFGRKYNIEVRGLQGISTLSEYGLRDVTGLVDFISSRKIKAVFVESSVPAKSLEAVISGCKSKGHEVRIGGTLFSDAMGNPGTKEGTYEGMVLHNAETISKSLK